jgi:hypothetical protein
MSSAGAAPRAAVPVSNARAEASRRNGAKSRGPKTPEGKARSAQNALRHGMRAQRYVVLPDEDAVEFAELQAALIEELAPVGALQTVLARQVPVAAWRLARADRIEAGLFEERRWDDGDLGLALIRDGNGTRSFETLMRYRNAAMAEFMRALRTLKALQAEEAMAIGPDLAHPEEPAARPLLAHRPQPNEPEGSAGHRLHYVMRDQPVPGRTLHEPAAPWMPNEPDHRPAPRTASTSAPRGLMPNEPECRRVRGPAQVGTERRPAPVPADCQGTANRS